MYTNELYRTTTAIAELKGCQRDDEFWMTRSALRLYQRSYNQGQLGRVWAVLTGRRRCLFSLRTVERTFSVRDRFYAGIQSVPIECIRGSEGRCADFDANFRPRRAENRGRWVSIAIARKMGLVLPPVDLIQVGGIFFVRDGHQRISVARALGQKDIDALVTVWNVAEPLPASMRQTVAMIGINQRTISEGI